jgi:hypothetical protein
VPVLNFRSPVEKPLLRKGTPKPIPPDPRAYDTFRVTQQFSDVDFYHKDGRLHNATDIGNFRCGDPIVAMAPGVAYRVADSAGALGIRINHGHGITSEYWHLNRQDASHGQPVNAGFRIGIVGRTGLGDVCHTHIEVKRDGTRIDPEPLMFGGFLVVEDDVTIPTDLTRTPNKVGTILGSKAVGIRIRRAPVDGAVLVTLPPSDFQFMSLGQVTRPDGVWRLVLFHPEGADHPPVIGWVRSDFTSELRDDQPAPVADCSAEKAQNATLQTTVESQAATIAELKTKISAAKTALA